MSTLTGAPTVAACARARCFSSPSLRLASCKRSRTTGAPASRPGLAGNRLAAAGRRRKSGRPRPTAGLGRLPAFRPRPPTAAPSREALLPSCADAGTPCASGIRAGRVAAPAPHAPR
eukprot:5415618-Alexandrium_andersonii.AAC.1